VGAAAKKAEELLPTALIPWGYDDDSEIWDLYRVTGTPTAVYLSARGEVLAVAPGALPQDLETLFTQLVEQGS
jgi:thioredoxin-related protein